MKANVYSDKSLERYAGRFVWLSINTEAPESAAFLQKYPIPALPTLLIVDRESVAVRYVGGANLAQLRTMLDDAEQKHRSRLGAEADKLLSYADTLASRGEHLAAVKSYEAALKIAPGRWKRLGRTAESLIIALSTANDFPRCATRAMTLYPRLKGTIASANVAATGLTCAIALDKEDPKRFTFIDALEKATREVFHNRKLALSGDDRSGLYIALIEARDASGDEEGTIALKAEWASFLEQAAATAKTAEQRAVYDSHRVSAYLDLGTPEKAVPMLEQSQKDFPNDYNPPARLALIYNAMKEYDRALEYSDRAMELVYGPRKLSVMSVRVEIFKNKGDLKAARDTMAEAIGFAKSLPEGQRSEQRIATMEERLAKMQ